MSWFKFNFIILFCGMVWTCVKKYGETNINVKVR